MDKTKHTSVKYVRGRHQACREVNNRLFRDLVELPSNIYEIKAAKNRIVHDIPTQLAYYILQLAKLHMLSFHYDFLDKFLSREDYEMCEFDTDSSYFACTRGSLEAAVRPELRGDFLQRIKGHCYTREEFAPGHFLPRECCREHNTYDAKVPGIFHLESLGVQFVGLCSKAYAVLETENNVKFSAKGCQKRRLTGDVMATYKSVLDDGEVHQVSNRGFRLFHTEMRTYVQRKRGLTSFYIKRLVHDDLIHTSPLPIAIRPYWRKDEEEGVDE